MVPLAKPDRRPFRYRSLHRPTTLVLSGFLLIPASGWAQAMGPATEELKALHDADQADRRFTSEPTKEQWEAISAREAERQARVYELLKGDQPVAAEDFHHAAMVLQHGDTYEDILLSHILSTAAAYKGDERGRWPSAASLDLHRTRMPQRFGKQYVAVSREDPFEIDGSQPWSQEPWVKWLPDSIREIFGVDSLATQAGPNDERQGAGPLTENPLVVLSPNPRGFANRGGVIGNTTAASGATQAPRSDRRANFIC